MNNPTEKELDQGRPMPVHILKGGPDRKIIDENGKEWIFEDHPYCGPSVLNKKGDPADKQPGPKSPFWICVNLWYAQGKKVVDGLCIWQPVRKEKWKHIAGKHYQFDGYEDEVTNASN